MDSGNSGSMQSSSGGDEEYDSRAETISPFFNPSVSFGSISNHPQPPPQPPPLFHHHQSHHPPTLFDPQAHNLGPFSHSPVNPNANHLYNLDLVWSRGLRSEPNYTDLGNLTGLSSSSSTLPSSSQSLIGVQGPSQGPFPSSSSSSMPLLPSVDGNGGIGGASATTPPRSDQTITNQVKSSRKRTRASRRAPTTVLTTDTSNFRQMVQEFTGIPAPPFSGSSSPYSRRLDLFGAGSALRSGHLDSLGPLYSFRPSAQKVQLQPSPFVSSSSSPSFLNSTMNIDAITTTNNSTTTNNNITTTTSIAGPSNTFSSTSSSYHQQQQHPSDLGFLSKQPHSQTMLNNPILTFQSLLQSPVFGSKSEGSSGIPSLDELGMTHEHVNANLSGFPSHGSSDGVRVGSNNHLSRWRSGEEASTERDHHQEHLGSFDGDHGEDSQNVSSYKLNCLASTSDFHHEN